MLTWFSSFFSASTSYSKNGVRDLEGLSKPASPVLKPQTPHPDSPFRTRGNSIDTAWHDWLICHVSKKQPLSHMPCIHSPY